MGGGGQQTQPTVPDILRPQVNDAQSQINQFRGLTLDPRTYSMTPLQGQIQNSASSLLSPGGTVPNLQSFLQSVLSPGFANPANNPNISSALNMAQDRFTQGLGKNLDMLGSQFGLSGQVPQRSGAFGQQATNLSRSALSDYGTNIGNILFGQYNTGVNQQLQAASQVPMISQILNSLAPTAALPQQLAQQQQTGQLDLSQIPFSMIMQLLQATPVGYPSYNPDNTLSQIGGILGGLGGLGGGAAALLSL